LLRSFCGDHGESFAARRRFRSAAHSERTVFPFTDKFLLLSLFDSGSPAPREND
jgi:hypothetical protein